MDEKKYVEVVWLYGDKEEWSVCEESVMWVKLRVLGGEKGHL